MYGAALARNGRATEGLFAPAVSAVAQVQRERLLSRLGLADTLEPAHVA